MEEKLKNSGKKNLFDRKVDGHKQNTQRLNSFCFIGFFLPFFAPSRSLIRRLRSLRWAANKFIIPRKQNMSWKKAQQRRRYGIWSERHRATKRSEPTERLVPSNFKIPNVFNYLFNIKTFLPVFISLCASLSLSLSSFAQSAVSLGFVGRLF